MSGGAPQPAAAPADAAVALRGVTHRYGQALALHEVSLELPRGASIALVGPDGVGKSTLLALAAGVKRIQSGGVLTLGQDLADARGRAALAARVAFMPQGLGHNLYPTLSVAARRGCCTPRGWRPLPAARQASSPAA